MTCAHVAIEVIELYGPNLVTVSHRMQLHYDANN
jgi:hypothetical protein